MRRIRLFEEFVAEDRAQYEIPFEHPGAEPSLHDKPLHVHVIDALESMDVMPDVHKYYSRMDLGEAWDEAYPKALEIYKRNLEVGQYENPEDDPDMSFIMDNWKDDDVWSDVAKEFVAGKEKSHGDYRDYLEAVEHIGEEGSFTKVGMERLDAERDDAFSRSIEKNGIREAVERSYDSNAAGLIDIWRAVLIRKSDSAEDVFEDITKRFGGVGFYWSWKRDGAIVYHMAQRGGTSVKFRGKVRVEDIDWTSTIYKASYFLNNEDEVTINEGDGLIMIESVSFTGKEVALDSPVVVPTGRYVYHG